MIENSKFNMNVIKPDEISECLITNVEIPNGPVIQDLNSHFINYQDKVQKAFEFKKVPLCIIDLERIRGSISFGRITEDLAKLPENLLNPPEEEEPIQLSYPIKPRVVMRNIPIFELLTSEIHIKEFMFSTAKYLDGSLLLKPKIKQLEDTLVWMEKYIAINCEHFEVMTNFDDLRMQYRYPRTRIDVYCLVKRDNKFFRGKVMRVAEDVNKATILLEDIPEVVEETLSVGNLYTMDPELFYYPSANIPVRLRSREPFSEQDEKKVKALIRELDNLKSAEAKEKCLKAKVFQYITHSSPIVEIFDPHSNKKIA